MAITSIQYLDDHGNVIPVYITDSVETYDEWKYNGTTYRLTRTFTCSADVMLQVSYKGGLAQAYVQNPTCIACAFKGNNNNKYLYVHDDLYVGLFHYTYDYTYVTNVNPLNYQSTYYIGQYALSTDLSEPFYFFKGKISQANPTLDFAPTPYISSGVYDWALSWVLDPNSSQPTTSDLYGGPTYIGLYRNKPAGAAWYANLPDSYCLPFIIGVNASIACWAYGLVYGWDAITTLECYDRMTIIYSNYYWEGIAMTGVNNPFIHVYLPDDNDLSDFSYWLWGSQGIVTQFQKMIEDPFNAIISLHAIYAPIPSNGAESIVLGNLTAASHPYIAGQTIITLTCGEIQVPEFFNNVLDYDPYTKIEIYLPYIGFRPIKADECVGGSVSVSYNIDILTGCCVANVSITKNNQTIVMYTYSGNCAVQIPITGANYSSVVGNMIGAALSIGTAVASGGVTTPLAVGAVGNAILNSKVQVERSGALGGNCGVLGYHKPYLLISRPIPAQATNFEQYYGYPTNQLALLSNCSGFTRVKDCKLSGFDATEQEKDEIVQLLKAGVFI